MEAEEELVKEKSSLALSKEPPIILKTSFQKCPVCLIGTIVNTQEKSTLLICGSFGVKVAEHQVHRCSNRNKLNPCRIGALYGYIIIDGEKIHTWMPLERISCGVNPNSIWKWLPYWGSCRHLSLAGLLWEHFQEVQPSQKSAASHSHSRETDGALSKDAHKCIFPLCLPWIWSQVCHQRLAKSQGQRGGNSDGSKRWACQIFSGEVDQGPQVWPSRMRDLSYNWHGKHQSTSFTMTTAILEN